MLVRLDFGCPFGPLAAHDEDSPDGVPAGKRKPFGRPPLHLRRGAVQATLPGQRGKKRPAHLQF